MNEKASIPLLDAAVAAVSPNRESIQVSMNCMTVYDAICATVGSAIESISTIGRRGGSLTVIDDSLGGKLSRSEGARPVARALGNAADHPIIVWEPSRPD